MDFDACPVDLAGGGGVFQHWHEQIAHAFELHLARATGAGLGHQGVNPAAVEEFDPQAHHAVGAVKLLANGGAADAQKQRTECGQADVTTLGGRSFHGHAQGFGPGVLRVGLKFRASQRSVSNTLCQKVPVQNRPYLEITFGNRSNKRNLRSGIRFL
jgi:hypothetical protein